MAFVKKFDGTTDNTVTLGKEGNPKSIEGYFLGSKEVQSDYGPGKLHIFQTRSGTTGVWGKTRLNTLLTDDLRGQMVRATFTGMVQPSKKGMRPSYGFSVEHDNENTIDVNSVNVNVSEPTQDSLEESDEGLFEEEQAQEEVTAPRPKSPIKAATVDASRQAKIQALLNSKK